MLDFAASKAYKRVAAMRCEMATLTTTITRTELKLCVRRNLTGSLELRRWRPRV